MAVCFPHEMSTKGYHEVVTAESLTHKVLPLFTHGALSYVRAVGHSICVT